MKGIWMKKGLVVSVIVLFMGVAVAPSINITVVKASNNDLVEVTTQACGIKGYGNTTAKLTREQYRDLEEYLVEFRARLNQTSTRAEAIPIFKEAVVELNKYGLLSKGMNLERAQRLIIGPSRNPIAKNTIKVLPSNYTQSGIENFLCLVSGHTNYTYPLGCLGFIPYIPFLLLFFYIPIHFWLAQFLGPVVFGTIYFEMKLRNHIPYPSEGWVVAVGLNGMTEGSGAYFGNIRSVEVSMVGQSDTYYVGMNSFTGIILGFQGTKFFLGFTPHLDLAESTYPN
jgi:hypothetical protein